MKQLIIIVFVAILLSACADTTKKFVGQWRLIENDSTKNTAIAIVKCNGKFLIIESTPPGTTDYSKPYILTTANYNKSGDCLETETNLYGTPEIFTFNDTTHRLKQGCCEWEWIP